MLDAYGDELGAAFGQFWTREEQLDDEERAQLVVRRKHQLDGPAPTHP